MIQDAIDTRSEYYKHIVLSGWSSIYPGLHSRLEKDIRSIYLDEVREGGEGWRGWKGRWRCVLYALAILFILVLPLLSPLSSLLTPHSSLVSLLSSLLSSPSLPRLSSLLPPPSLPFIGVEGRRRPTEKVQDLYWGPSSSKAHGVPGRQCPGWHHEGQAWVLDHEEGVWWARGKCDTEDREELRVEDCVWYVLVCVRWGDGRGESSFRVDILYSCAIRALRAYLFRLLNFDN